MLNDTIAAISTALQDGAISIIRISGEQAIEVPLQGRRAGGYAGPA